MTATTSTVLSGTRLRWTVAFFAVIAATNAAQARDDFPQTTVQYEDLDLTQHQDTVVLYQRLRFASAQVCGVGEVAGLQQKLLSRQCYREALEGAIQSVDNAALTAMHHATDSVRVAQRAAKSQPRS
jgi:UrcA family protein